MSIKQEFKDFIMRGNVIDLAVGMVVGTAFSGIVKSLVDDVIMPPIGIVLGGIDFSNLFLTLKHGVYQHHHQLFDCGNGDFCGGESHQHAEKSARGG